MAISFHFIIQSDIVFLSAVFCLIDYFQSEASNKQSPASDIWGPAVVIFSQAAVVVVRSH